MRARESDALSPFFPPPQPPCTGVAHQSGEWPHGCVGVPDQVLGLGGCGLGRESESECGRTGREDLKEDGGEEVGQGRGWADLPKGNGLRERS